MKTNETQTSTPHQSTSTKPFFGARSDQAFFSAERAPATPFFRPPAGAIVQAKPDTDAAKDFSEADVQRMPAFASEVIAEGAVQRSLLSAFPIQAKLTIGPVGDRYEQEADRVAAQVVEQIHTPTTGQSSPEQAVQRQEEKKEELQAKPEITALQRMEEKPEELQAKSILQRQGMAGGEASPDLDTAINLARGSGQPLDAGLQRSMGQAMGADFSGVKVHTDAQSDRLNRSIQAKAFTTGQDVFFRQGAYEPASRGGQELIAHELTHVVQQNGGAVQPTMQLQDKSGNDEKGLQQEANVMGRAGTIDSGAIVQRQNLEQTKWVEMGNLEKEKERRGVVGDGRNVNVYVDKSIIPATDKLDALQKLAARNADIGKTVDEKAKVNWGIAESNDKWTGKWELLDNEKLKKLDPFFYEGIAKWGKDTGDEKYLGFMFQHAASFTGYIESILDTSNPSVSQMPSMYIEETESSLKDTRSGDRNLKFSNIHDQTDTVNLLTLSGSGGEEKNLDAYTKIAGEGARWQCVRKHASKLKNTSRFFTAIRTDGKALAVTFTYLWLNWKEKFDKGYDITDRTVVDKLRSTDLGREVRFDQLNENDYDLDLSRGFETPFHCLTNVADYFYTLDENPRKVLYVSRRDLWMNWMSVFNGNYNINSKQVADAIWEGKIKSAWLWKDKLTNSYYNLGT